MIKRKLYHCAILMKRLYHLAKVALPSCKMFVHQLHQLAEKKLLCFANEAKTKNVAIFFSKPFSPMEVHLPKMGAKKKKNTLADSCELMMAGGTFYLLQLVTAGLLWYGIKFWCIWRGFDFLQLF